MQKERVRNRNAWQVSGLPCTSGKVTQRNVVTIWTNRNGPFVVEVKAISERETEEEEVRERVQVGSRFQFKTTLVLLKYNTG